MVDQKEKERLKAHNERTANWKKWGPYLSERAWGTVREDYSESGDAWEYFPHDHAALRAYRWNEDGIGGISDRNQYICFACSFWNGKDPILKERLFGLTNSQGNHGEDVKEYYFYLDNTPTHSYMKMLYKYPQNEFPYQELVSKNRERRFQEQEFELFDTQIFRENRYFDICIEYAKANERDIYIKISAINRGPEEATLSILPTIWFRKIWGWGYPKGPLEEAISLPSIHPIEHSGEHSGVALNHPSIENYYLLSEETPEWIFTDNETNEESLFGVKNKTPYVKDAFHRYVIHKETKAVNPQKIGTKAACIYQKSIPSSGSSTVRLRLVDHVEEHPFDQCDSTFSLRQKEADAFYDSLSPNPLKLEQKKIQKQAFAGLLWSKQFYYYDFEQWVKGDVGPSSIKTTRKLTRSSGWEHLFNFDILSMPDKWEYPWYASWDLAFHCIPFSIIDPNFAKRQLILMTREWYMHPNGQIPAYEWDLNDANPPTLAWAAWRVYKIDAKQSGHFDRPFLESIFHKLLLNFNWWVNRKDQEGNNIFQGGFLGLDNISMFDRSKLTFHGRIDQSDGTAWMSFYCILMMKIALELAKEDSVYQDSATKFFEHFLRIASALHDCGRRGHSLWDKEDGFFYDALHLVDGTIIPIKARSLVGLLPLFAVETIEPEILTKMPTFQARMNWFIKRRPFYTHTMSCVETEGIGKRHLMAILTKEQLLSLLHYLLDENEFLSEFGIRSLSKYHEKNPCILNVEGKNYSLSYQPRESQDKLFGGNSNWRGPIWFPINFLIIESLQKFHHYYGDELQVECPTGSGKLMNLNEVANEISNRLIKLFIPKADGIRPIYGKESSFFTDPHWQDLILFHEYYHGDTGIGLGACHQTGWTALIAKLIQQSGS